MTIVYRLLLIILCLSLAAAFFTVNSEREFIIFNPQEGELAGIVLQSGHDYRQSFTVYRRSLSRLSLALRPTIETALPNHSFTFILYSGSAAPLTKSIPVSFIDREGVTRIDFDPPLFTNPGDTISFSLSIPPELSGLLRAQTVNIADSPDLAATSFTIDNQPQPVPLAWQMFYDFHPPLSYQLGIFLLWLAFWLVLRLPLSHPVVLSSYVLAAVIAYLSPAVFLGQYYWLLALSSVAAMAGMILLLRSLSLSAPLVLFGANAFAFSTFFALHSYAGRPQMLAFSLIPLLCFLFINTHPKRRLLLLAITIICLLIFLFAAPYHSPAVSPLLVASLKDILLDPNQIPTADKFQAAYYALQIPRGDPSVVVQSGWEHFGSYIGFINLSFSLLGLLFYARRFWLVALIGLAGLTISALPFTTPYFLSRLWLPPQYFIILLSFALAFFAAFGLSKLQSFLRDSRLTQFIIYMIAIFALFDLLNVTSKTIQFGLL